MSTTEKKRKIKRNHIVIFIAILFCVGFVFKSSAFISQSLTKTTQTIGTQTKKIIANTI
jgi:hypothetical protein